MYATDFWGGGGHWCTPNCPACCIIRISCLCLFACQRRRLPCFLCTTSNKQLHLLFNRPRVACWCTKVPLLHNIVKLLEKDIKGEIKRERHTPCAHRTVHRFYLDNVRETIVLLCWCPVRCCFAELVPDFTLSALRNECIVHFIPWIAQQHNVIVLRSSCYPCLLHCSSANEWVPATLLGPSQCPGDYLCIQYEVYGKVVIHDAAALHPLEFHIHPSRTHQEIPATIQSP